MQDDLDSVSFGAHRNLGAVMRLYVECDAIGPEGNGPVMEQAPAMRSCSASSYPECPPRICVPGRNAFCSRLPAVRALAAAEDGDK